MIENLKNRADLNGQMGTITLHDSENMRVGVKLSNIDKGISVKPENAKILIRMREIDLGTIYFSDGEDE